jgi:hypothetical protein
MNNKKFPLGAIVLVLVALLIAVAALSLPNLERKSASPAAAKGGKSASDQLAGSENSLAPSDATTIARTLASAASATTSASPVPAAASVPAPASDPSSPASGVRSTTLPAPAGARVSAAAAQREGVVPDPNRGPAWPTGFTVYRTTAEILAGKDLGDPEQRALAVAEMSEAEEVRYEAVLAKAEQLGIPVRVDGAGNEVSILHDIRGEEPVYRVTQNRNAAISSGADLLYPAPYSLGGTGVKVGVWDAGRVRNTHQEFNTNRVVNRNATAPLDDHATHVAGTVGASGFTASAKGMAPSVAIDSWDWNSDYAEMTQSGAATASGDTNKIPLSNHSYGYNAGTADMGVYNSESVETDLLAVNMPYYLICWAAGNEQDFLTAKGGFQSITYNGLSKNILTVGAVNDAVSGGVRSPSAGTMSDFSSWGPSDDGRIKPDVVANGVTVNSPIDTSNTSYASYSGTSMATPSVTGSAALLAQLYAREFAGQRMRSSMLKGLLIHTADDLGNAGPDYKFGWGLINVKAAADVIIAHKASLAAPKMIEDTLTAAVSSRTHTFQWDGVSPIRVTLCWTDPVGTAQADNSRTPNLRHNLDLTVTAPNTTVLRPYIMPFVGSWTDASMNAVATTGKNNVDNVEQIFVASPTQAGTYTITVARDGALTTSSQSYALIVTGGANVETNPPPVANLTAPVDGRTVLPGAAVELTATATDLALGGGSGVVSSVSFYVGETLISTDTSSPYEGTWTAPSASGEYVLTARATDSEGAVGTSAPVKQFVLSGTGEPTISSFTPSNGAVGTVVTITGSNFAGVTAVRFNGFDTTTFTVDSLTQITATVPTTASTGAITVVTPRGTATSSTNFTVLQSPVLISQVYGAGGNSGATFNSDYVELYNRSDAAVNLTGWTVQYASASGTTWATVGLSGSIAPGKYHLVKLAGGTTGAALPAADSTGSINMSGTQGKVALRNTATTFTGSTPVGQAGLQDFVGFGTANAYEGSGAASAPSSTTAIFRGAGGATDTGDNRNDFAAGAPNPRNSSFGSVVAPVITSPTTASGTVGQSFSYQITASNNPTSFGATGLPAGLTVNTSTGLISGTPSAAGTSTVSLSASNSAGTGPATLTIIISSGGGGGGGVTLLNEDFASLTSGDNTSTGGSGVTWSGNTNLPTVVRGYQAGGAVKLGTGSATGSLTTKTLDLSSGGGAFTVSFKVKGWTTVEGDLTVTVTGLAPQTVTYSSVMAGAFETKTVSFSGGTANSTVTIATTAKRAFLDDLVITTASVQQPGVSASGNLSVLSSTYGSPSLTATSFTVSGANLTQGILVDPPDGFEVSLAEDGASGFAATQTISGSGTIAPTSVFIRLAAGQAAGFYSGNVICTSGSASATLSVPEGEVQRKGLNIRANDQSKIAGQTLTLGPGQTAFSATGLVGTETVGSVTISASGGTAAGDPAGTYVLTPSLATGGTFSAANYDINYIDGTLTVIGSGTPTFGDWATQKGLSGANAAADADPDNDSLANLLEYYMGLEPLTPDKNVVSMGWNPGNPSSLSMTYRRAKGTTGVTGGVVWNSLLNSNNWSTSGIVTTTNNGIPPESSYEELTSSVTNAPSEAAKFLRLRVTQP